MKPKPKPVKEARAAKKKEVAGSKVWDILRNRNDRRTNETIGKNNP